MGVINLGQVAALIHSVKAEILPEGATPTVRNDGTKANAELVFGLPDVITKAQVEAMFKERFEKDFKPDVYDRLAKMQEKIQENNKLLKKLESNAFVERGVVGEGELDSVVVTGSYSVEYVGYKGALMVFNVGGSVGIVQFLKDGYDETFSWKYRNALDSDTSRWTSWRTVSTRE